MAQTNVFANIASSNMVAVPEDISDEIAHLQGGETPLLTKVGLNSLLKPCTNTTHKYLEIMERAKRSTLNGAVNQAATTVVISDAIFEAGELVVVDEEVIALGSTSDNLTFTSCTRSKGAGADHALSDGAPVIGLGEPAAQGAASGSTSDHVIYPDTITNYTHIFSKDIVVSGTANALNRYGRAGTEFDYVAQRQLVMLKKEMEHNLLWGYDVAPSGTTTAGQANGIYERISSYATDLGDSAADMGHCRTAVRNIVDWDGRPDTAVCSLYMKDVIDSYGVAHVTHITDPSDPVVQMYGNSVTRLFVGGQQLDVLPMSNVSGQMFFLSTANIGCGPLVGRQFQLIPIAKDGDRTKALALGEYTFEVPAPRRHYVLTSVAAS